MDASDKTKREGLLNERFRRQMQYRRESAGMSQNQLATILAKQYDLPFHQQTIQRIETGQRPIRLDEAECIAMVIAGGSLESMFIPLARDEAQLAVDRLRKQARSFLEGVQESLADFTAEGVGRFAELLLDMEADTADIPNDSGSNDTVELWVEAWAIKVAAVLKKAHSLEADLIDLSSANEEPTRTHWMQDHFSLDTSTDKGAADLSQLPGSDLWDRRPPAADA